MYPRTGVVLFLIAASMGLTATAVLDGGGPIMLAIVLGLVAANAVVLGCLCLGMTDGR